MLFDTHAHYYDRRFDEDRDEILSSMKENNVGYIINAGCDIKSTNECIALSEKYDFCYATAGFHPGNIRGEVTDNDLAEIVSLAGHEKVVAIGEIGLDYHYEGFDKAQQQDIFAKQIAIAEKLYMPIVIHSRDACADTLDLLRSEYKGTGGVWHCFGESVETAKIALNMGLSFSIGGTVTFANNRRAVEAVSYIPLENILLETDAPYLAPTPYRGKRNSSLYIHLVAEKIAEIKGISPEEVENTTTENAKKLFGI